MASADWSVWSTQARLVVTEPRRLEAARDLVERRLAAIDAAASRFRSDSEVSNLHRAGGRPQRISPLLADLIRAALTAARRTDGDVDPTLGAALRTLGYDRDLALLSRPPRGHVLSDLASGARLRVVPPPASGWRRVQLDGTILSLPADLLLDLGATAKAVAADWCATEVADTLDTGVLVSLGGDVATAGSAPHGGWVIRVQDAPDDPEETVTIPAGAAIATSSTQSRAWMHDGLTLHHILDPRSGWPVAPVWRSVTVAHWRCVDANTFATAALVRGRPALSWLCRLEVPARLVLATGETVTTSGWPREGAA